MWGGTRVGPGAIPSWEGEVGSGPEKYIIRCTGFGGPDATDFLKLDLILKKRQEVFSKS